MPARDEQARAERRVIGHRRYPVGGQFKEPALLDKLDPKFWEAAPEVLSVPLGLEMPEVPLVPSWRRWLTVLRKIAPSVFRSR